MTVKSRAIVAAEDTYRAFVRYGAPEIDRMGFVVAAMRDVFEEEDWGFSRRELVRGVSGCLKFLVRTVEPRLVAAVVITLGRFEAALAS